MKLNLGSGNAPIEGWENFDHKNGHPVYPLKVDSDVAEVVRASHVLEHFPQNQAGEVLKEWVRVLKPGGVLKVAVPNFEWIAKEYLEGNTSGLPLFSYLMGGQVDENDYHKAAFNQKTLEYLFEQAGLTDIQPWQSDINDCAALPVSLNLMGRKPEAAAANGLDMYAYPKQHFVAGEWRDEADLIKDKVQVKSGIVMSTPRYGPLDAAECIFEIAAALNAPRFKTTGCWRYQGRSRSVDIAMDWRSEAKEEWEVGLTDALEQAVDAGMDVIFTIDYDTFATPDDAKALIKLLYENPQYDCVVPVQIRRGTFEEIMATFAGPADISQALVPILTGHFGLTVFRRHVFERLQRPWFLPKPDADGRWGDGRTDADIYFWNKFCDQGFKSALATQVVIGHGDEVVTWPRFENGKITKVYQPLYAWHANRKPPQ